jgi:methyl-accepting chemotaxis protein
MEAARAGEQGEGFAVVASEIRKLAASSTEAAERTEEMVMSLLGKVDESRESSRRTASTVAGVRQATELALTSFAEIECAVVDAEGWTRSIEQAANQSRELVAEATIRLEHVARGTETFAAAMQQVAAATQQQSAGAQEIAGASAALADASRKLLVQISAFRLDEIAIPTTPPARRRTDGVELATVLELAPATS